MQREFGPFLTVDVRRFVDRRYDVERTHPQVADDLRIASQQIASHGQRRAEEVLLFEHDAVEQTVLDRRTAREAEAAGRLAVEDEHHQRVEIESLSVGHHFERHGVHCAQLLDALDQIGQLADLVLALVGRALRGGREDAEAENIDEIESVDASAVHAVHRAGGDLPRRFERMARHAQRTREVVGRTGGNHSERDVQPFVFHGVDHVVNRAVAAGHDHQVDLLAAVEGIGAEVDQLRFDIVAVSPEYRADGFGAAFDFAFPGLGVVEKNSAFHRDRYCMIIASMAGEIYSS